jgi:hypothetical protein
VARRLREQPSRHAEGFEHPDLDLDWPVKVDRHDLGWVCERLRVDFEDHRQAIYDVCGFKPTNAGLIPL